MKLTCKRFASHPGTSFIPGWDFIAPTCKHGPRPFQKNRIPSWLPFILSSHAKCMGTSRHTTLGQRCMDVDMTLKCYNDIVRTLFWSHASAGGKNNASKYNRLTYKLNHSFFDVYRWLLIELSLFSSLVTEADLEGRQTSWLKSDKSIILYCF